MRHFTESGAKACCTDEKDRLMQDLYVCDYCTTSLEDRHHCYQRAAKESGRRARQCLAQQK